MTAVSPERRRMGRNNKARGKVYEREIARALGTTRHWGDAGGPEDLVSVGGMAIQIKSGKTVVTEVMREALASARLAAGTEHLPTVVLIDRRGTRIQRWIAFPFEEWAASNGYG